MQRVADYSYKRSFVVSSLLVVIVLLLNAGVANAVPVSTASGPSQPSSGIANSTGTVNTQLKSFQSGSWRQTKDGETSPAWNAFAQNVRVDMMNSRQGNIDTTFDPYLRPMGLDRKMCEASSVIWVVQDTGNRTGVTINIHSDFNAGGGAGSSQNKEKMLAAAPAIGGTTPTDNLGAIAKAVSEHQAISTMNFSQLKVICSAQFAEEVESPAEPEVVKECQGASCDPVKEEEIPPTVQVSGTCGDREGQWRGGRTLISGGSLSLAFAVGSLNAANGVLNGITSSLTSIGNALSNGQGTSYRWRCQTRYLSYYKVAPATYHTESELAPVAVKKGGVEIPFTSVREASEKSGSKWKSNSDMANIWDKSMKAISFVDSVQSAFPEARQILSDKTVTQYGKKWNEMGAGGRSGGSFDPFYNVTRGIDKTVADDENGGDFSSGVGLPATQQALLAQGGVLNVQEKERQKLVRVVQPYATMQINKCQYNAIEVLWGCEPGTQGINYDNEKVDTTLKTANEISLDQAKHLVARANNTLADARINPTEGLKALAGTANFVLNDLSGDLKRCTAGATQALDFPGTLEDFTSATGIMPVIGGVFKFLNKVNNGTLYCNDVVERGNPPYIPDLASKLLDAGAIAGVVATPGRASFSLTVVPTSSDYVVQRAQYSPETVSWWQVLSVNCNMLGFESAVARVPGAENFSDRIKNTESFNGINDGDFASPVGLAMHAVAKSPVVHVDYTKPETKYKSSNFMFARKGSDTYYLDFYDKECPFACSRNPGNPGSSDNNDAKGNTPNDHVSPNDVKNGMQVRDDSGAQTYKDGKNAGNGNISKIENVVNSNFYNIFRDNEQSRFRVDTWIPSNNAFILEDYLRETNNLGSNTSVVDTVNALLRYASSVFGTASGTGGTLGLLYDGSSPSSTTVTRFKDGTPEINKFFKMYGVTETGDKGKVYGDKELRAGEGTHVPMFDKTTAAKVPTQKAWSQDIDNANGPFSAMFDGLVNTFDVQSSWASEKSKPQVFNIKWEYQSGSAFLTVTGGGFSRNGTKDKDVTATASQGMTFTVVEGKCYGAFGTNVSRNVLAETMANTGTNSNNRVDNRDTGINSGSPAIEVNENFYVNSLRATSE